MRTDDDVELAKPSNKYESVSTQKPEKTGTRTGNNEDEERNEIGYWGLSMSLLLMILLWAVCIGLRYINKDWGAVDCELDNTDDVAESICIRQNTIYRVTAVVSTFFGAHGIISLYNVVGIFEHYWLTVKFPLIAVASFCLIYFSYFNAFDDDVFVWWARIGAFIFIIFQQVILLDFAYWWNSKWFTKHRSSNPIIQDYIDSSDCNVICRSVWLLLILAVAAVLFVIFIAAMALLYHFYGGDGCGTNNTIISLSMIGMLAAGVLQLSSSNGSLMTTTVLMAYVAYITYSAVSLSPDANCNAMADNETVQLYGTGPAITGLIISLVSMIYMSTITTRAVSAMMTSGDVSNVALGKNSGRGSAPDLKKKLRRSIFFINFVYGFLSLYLAMTLSNWGLRVRSAEVADPETSEVGMWMQAVAAWIVIVMYIVALLKPNFNFFPRSVWDFYPR